MIKGNSVKIKLNTSKFYDSIVQGQVLQYYSNLNHTFNMLLPQPEVRRKELQLDILV